MKREYIIYIVVILILFLIVKLYVYNGSRLIGSEQAKNFIKSGKIIKIIDIRTNLEYRLGHYPSAINIPVSSFSQGEIHKHNIGKKDGILVYCNTGERARYAADLLESYGYSNVYYISTTYLPLL
jgi:rhodanese-related sulfurtransferase